MYQTKAEREKYYDEKLANVKRKETRESAKFMIDLQEDSIKRSWSLSITYTIKLS